MIRNNFKLILFILLIFVFFRPFFTFSDLSWGDAPYYFHGEFANLLNGFSVWSSEGNNFGGINALLWLYPINFLIGFLGSVLRLDHLVIVRIVFYFPSLIMAVTTSYLLAKELGLKKGAWAAALLYVFNSYYLLLVDGGQVGVVLSYGFLPLVVLSLIKLKFSLANYVFSTLILNFAVLIDPRIAFVGVLGTFIYRVLEFVRNGGREIRGFLAALFLVCASVLLMNMFWIYPLFALGGIEVGSEVSRLNLFSLVNGFTLFQPHWPVNIFGEVRPPLFYFLVLPIFIWSGLLVDKRGKLYTFLLLNLIFIFILKGENAPFGQLYKFILSLPFGFVFRDSSKFFPGVILFSSLSLSFSVSKRKNNFFSIAVFLAVIAPLLPGLTKFNFVLSRRVHDKEFYRIGEYLSDTSGRALWIPERYPIHFNSDESHALDGRLLTEYPLFAINNVGSHDKLNYLHNSDSISLLKRLGVTYLVLSQDHRSIAVGDEEILEREMLIKSIKETDGITRVDGFERLYQILGARPYIYTTDSLAIYSDYLEGIYENENSAIAFLSDGTFRIEPLFKAPYGSMLINASTTDVAMNLLIDEIYEIPQSEWAKYDSSRRLEWQYQLLTRGLALKSLDYKKGVAFSDRRGERVVLREDAGQNVFALRAAGSKEARLVINTESGQEFIEFDGEAGFSWYVFTLDKPYAELVNDAGLVVLNVYSFVEKSRFDEALEKASSMISNYKSLEKDGWYKVDYKRKIPTYFRVGKTAGNYLIVAENYHKDWLINDSVHFSVYGGFNGFLLEPETDADLVFRGQRHLIYGTAMSFAAYLVCLVAIIKLCKRG